MSLRQWPQGKALLLVQAAVSDLLPIVQLDHFEVLSASISRVSDRPKKPPMRVVFVIAQPACA
jgi:hypothetical protein